jgi:hypothetical protein
MSIDLSKLSPAPWSINARKEIDCKNLPGIDSPTGSVCDFGNSEMYYPTEGNCPGEADFEFMVLARNAFDVMTRRSWYVIPAIEGGWSICATTVFDNPYEHDGSGDCGPKYDDPFTALVEADKWYRKNVESESTPKENANAD